MLIKKQDEKIAAMYIGTPKDESSNKGTVLIGFIQTQSGNVVRVIPCNNKDYREEHRLDTLADVLDYNQTMANLYHLKTVAVGD